MCHYVYGHDFGNSETCGALSANGKLTVRTLPSMTAIGSMQELKALDISLKKDDYVLKQGSRETYIGNLALSQSSQASSGRGDINRYWSERSLQLLLTGIASQVPDKELSVHVVTGLPVSTYMAGSEPRKRVKQALNGSHTFQLNGVERTIHIEVLKVVMEGAGATICYGLSGKIPQAVIDIGGRTTDLYASIGQEPLSQQCAGKPLGVELAGDRLNKLFEWEYGRPLTAKEIRDTLYAYADHKKKYPRLFAQGKEVSDIAPLAQKVLHDVGSEIVSFTSTTWNDSETGSVAGGFAQVLLIGGGAHYFKEQVTSIIPSVVIPNSPECANATGYAKLAEKLLKQSAAV